MLLTDEIFEAFLKCETKAYLKLTSAAGSQTEFTDWRQQITADYKHKCSGIAGRKLQSDESIPIRFVPNEKITKDDKLLLVDHHDDRDG